MGATSRRWWLFGVWMLLLCLMGSSLGLNNLQIKQPAPNKGKPTEQA